MRKVIVLTLALAGCVPVAPAPDAALPDPVPPLASVQAAPQLALLENVLREYFAAEITNRPTVCAAVHDGREDAALPTEDERALMERFPTLAPLSRCSLQNGGWVDTESEAPALVFTLHSFACTSDASCSGWVGYRAGAAAGLSNRYEMAWDSSAWGFTRDPRAIAQ